MKVIESQSVLFIFRTVNTLIRSLLDVRFFSLCSFSPSNEDIQRSSRFLLLFPFCIFRVAMANEYAITLLLLVVREQRASTSTKLGISGAQSMELKFLGLDVKREMVLVLVLRIFRVAQCETVFFWSKKKNCSLMHPHDTHIYISNASSATYSPTSSELGVLRDPLRFHCAQFFFSVSIGQRNEYYNLNVPPYITPGWTWTLAVLSSISNDLPLL